MNLKKLKNNKKGFTLIEIIVVVVILAVLMAVAVPAVMSYLDEADDAKFETAGHALFTAVQTEYARDYADDKNINGSAWGLTNDNTKYQEVAINRVIGDEDQISAITISNVATSTDKKSVKGVTASITYDGVTKSVTVDANKSVKVSKAS